MIIEPTHVKLILREDLITVQTHINITKMGEAFTSIIKDFNQHINELQIKYPTEFIMSNCWAATNLQNSIKDIEGMFLKIMNFKLTPMMLRDIVGYPELELQLVSAREKRAIVPIIGTILSKIIGTGSEKTERQINSNIHVIDENIHTLGTEFNSMVQHSNETEEQLFNLLKINNLKIKNTTQTFTAVAILNANCLNLTTLMESNLSVQKETLVKLNTMKDTIPYGKIPLPKKQLQELLKKIGKKNEGKGLKVTEINLEELPIFDFTVEKGIIIYRCNVPLVRYKVFNIINIKPLIFISPAHKCNSSACTFYTVDIKYKKIGVTKDGQYTKIPGVCMESEDPVKICTSRDTIIKPSNCLENIINGKNLENCNILPANRNIKTPIFDYINNGKVLITSTRKMIINIKCDQNQNITKVKVAKGSSTINIENNCALIHKGIMRITPNHQEKPLEIVTDEYTSIFKLPPNTFNMNFTHIIDNITDSSDYLHNYVPQTIELRKLKNININSENQGFEYMYILVILNIILILITLVFMICMVKTYIRKKNRVYNIRRRRQQENIPMA